MESSEILANVGKTAAWLKKRTAGFKPHTAVIAGSGLGNSLPQLADKVSPASPAPPSKATQANWCSGAWAAVKW